MKDTDTIRLAGQRGSRLTIANVHGVHVVTFTFRRMLDHGTTEQQYRRPVYATDDMNWAVTLWHTDKHGQTERVEARWENPVLAESWLLSTMEAFDLERVR